jgi:hypothetical protein
MKASGITVGALVATTAVTIGVTIGGLGCAAADPGTPVPVDPNVVTDSNAFSAAPPVQNPDGQMGVTAVYSHRDGTRQITNTILIFPDPAAATAAMNGPNVSQRVVNGKTQPVVVGTSGTLIAGKSPDGSQSVSVLQFSEGNAMTTVEFAGPPNDPVPVDLVTEYGQQQDAALRGV